MGADLPRRARPFTDAFPALAFKAWRVGQGGNGIAIPADLPDGIETAEQAAAHAGANHKDSVIVLASDDARRPEQRHIVHVYLIKKSSTKGFWRDAYDGGRKLFEGKLEPTLISRFAVNPGFDPVRPFDAFHDDPVGRDGTLVVVR